MEVALLTRRGLAAAIHDRKYEHHDEACAHDRSKQKGTTGGKVSQGPGRKQKDGCRCCGRRA